MTIKEINDLSQAHHAQFWALALSLTRDQDRARDLLQDVNYQVIKNRNSFKPGTDFPAWVSRIIRNVFISDYRRTKRRTRILTQKRLPDQWLPSGVVANAAIRRLEEEEVLALIHQLPPTFRSTFLMHFQGLNYREIAVRNGIPVGTVKSRIFAARKELRRIVRQVGMTA